MTSTQLVIVACLLTSQVLAWEALPQIPSGRRSQFLVLREDGAYKYGYDTGDGQAAKQEADTSNQVQGQFQYTNKAGKSVDLKYTSGVQGFIPEGLDKIQELVKSSGPSGPSAPSNAYLPAAQSYSGAPETGDDGDDGSYHPEKYDNENNSGDASYNFNVDTSSYKRTESSDSTGNIQGSYSYSNREGTHDLQYTAGAETGFVARSGSLSKPNGLRGGGGAGARSGDYQAPSSGYSYPSPSASQAGPQGPIQSDGSYSFGFATGDQSREESGDASGNVRGRYSYKNHAGSHDLSFQAGAETGFLVTGGSLAKPNGLPNGAGAGAGDYSGPSSYSAPASGSPSFRSSSGASGDGSYSFGFSTGSQDRQEDSDASGNVRGRFSYRNSAGTHDLSYVAGASTGFLPTGGSLSQPNGLKGGASPAGPSGSAYGSEDDGQYHPERDSAPTPTGYSYNPPSSGAYTGDDSGAYTGEGSQDDQANTGDSSYNFNFDTPEYTREEASDARGNVRGSFRYRNRAGSHDLSFVAGSETGYKPTGGSLSEPNGLAGKIVTPPESPSAPSISAPQSYVPSDTDTVEVGAARSAGDESSSGDSSYNFSFDTPEYTRQESSDAGGNVRGRFSYKNTVGNHDLSFEAGAGTGFKPIGGSLTPAPGLNEAQLRAGFRGSSGGSSRFSSFVSGGSSSSRSSFGSSSSLGAPLPDTKASYSLGNVRVHTYLPPSNEKHKFGYIFESQ